MQVAAGLSFTMFLTREGHVYTCGTNTNGQLGHGDTMDRPTPTLVELLEGFGSMVQISAGPSYSLAVAHDGTVYSFGSGTNFCLGHGEQHNGHQPRAILSFRRKGIHVVRVSAGDEHVVALDSCGYVSTFKLIDLFVKPGCWVGPHSSVWLFWDLVPFFIYILYFDQLFRCIHGEKVIVALWVMGTRMIRQLQSL